MKEDASPATSKLHSLGRFVLPVLMVLLCVGLYLFTGPLKPKNDANTAETVENTSQVTEMEASPKLQSGGNRSNDLPGGKLALHYAHEFFEAAMEAGFTDNCFEKATSLQQRDYSIEREGEDASLSLSLKNGGVGAFTFIVALPPQSEPGESLIRTDMLEVERDWLLLASNAFLQGLDGKARLTVADRNAFLLLVESTIIDGKAAEATLTGVVFNVELIHEAMLHISASLTEDY